MQSPIDQPSRAALPLNLKMDVQDHKLFGRECPPGGYYQVLFFFSVAKMGKGLVKHSKAALLDASHVLFFGVPVTQNTTWKYGTEHRGPEQNPPKINQATLQNIFKMLRQLWALLGINLLFGFAGSIAVVQLFLVKTPRGCGPNVETFQRPHF